jgi:hypothetical protein
MVYPIDQEREFAYWGEIGKWRGLCFISWIFLCDVGFNMITDFEEEGEALFNLKDGVAISWKNA